MALTSEYRILELPELRWPSKLQLPARFRLFVAADTQDLPVDAISAFAQEALRLGAVYVSTWGSGCERFHDIVDESIVENDLAARNSASLSVNDTVMTTWHANDTFEEALEFFATWARPTEGFIKDSAFRLVVCVNSPDWTERSNLFLKTANLLA